MSDTQPASLPLYAGRVVPGATADEQKAHIERLISQRSGDVVVAWLATEVERLHDAAEVAAAQIAALEAAVQASLFANRCPLCGYLPHVDDCPLRDGYDLDRLVTNHEAIKRETEAWLRKKLEAL